MPRAEGKVTVNNFVGGLVTDFHSLNQPQNTTVDEDNCDIDRKGSRKRRLGIDFETGYELSDDTFATADVPSLYLGNSVWEAVNNDGNRNFLVVQVGSTLYYYDLAVNPVSAGVLPFTTDLTDFKFDASVTDADVAGSQISIASGKGVIFLCGEKVTPFYVTYTESSNTITETALNIRVRDFKQQSAVTDFENQPTSLTKELKYDYFNQGWYYSDIKDFQHDSFDSVLDMFYHLRTKYPALSKAWWLGKTFYKEDTFETFLADQYDAVFTGNLRAPLGHYIVDPFNIDRSAVSGIPSFEVEQSFDRPTSIAFYAGKVVYGWKNQILFSQTLIDDYGVAAKCYQEADPTAEDINNLIATDGGVIPLQLSGQIVHMQPFENSLILFCTNGIWALGGTNIGAGFVADGFSLYKVSSIGSVSPRAVVDVDGTPVWWSKTGIYMLVTQPSKQGFTVENLCKDKIQLFYDAIPGASKLYASGAYDRLRKIITFVYNSETTALDGNPYFCNRVLNYDTVLGAWFPYTVSDLSDLTPRIADVFPLLDVSTTTEEVEVDDAASEIVVDAAGETVIVNESVIGNFDNQSNIGVKFLTFSKEIVSG